MTTLAEYHATVDELELAMRRLCARIDAGQYELLQLIRAFDERDGWLKWGCTSCVHWLHWRLDMSLSTAHEKVRMAHALNVLPGIAAAFASGALSYSKVRALTRVATPHNESTLLDYALNVSAARLEERCRQLRMGSEASIAGACSAHRARYVHLSPTDERGMVSLSAELPAELAQLLSKALDKAMEQEVPDGPEFEDESLRARQADALLVLAKHYLAGGDAKAGSAEQYQVVVQVDETALAGSADGDARSELPIESVRRLCCDGAIVPMVVSSEGEPLNVGRKRRTVSGALERALWARDGGCTFPGCTHTRFVDAHHVWHWAHGGETSLDNLMLLCDHHHRLVHEGGYTIHTAPDGERMFLRPDRRAVPRLGYSRIDMMDEEIQSNSSAEEGRGFASGSTACVREMPSTYALPDSHAP